MFEGEKERESRRSAATDLARATCLVGLVLTGKRWKHHKVTALTEETVLPSSNTQTPLLTPFRFTCCLQAPLNVGRTASSSVQLFWILSASYWQRYMWVLLRVRSGGWGRAETGAASLMFSPFKYVGGISSVLGWACCALVLPLPKIKRDGGWWSHWAFNNVSQFCCLRGSRRLGTSTGGRF